MQECLADLEDGWQEITQLKSEVSHYQNLYQARVEKDLGYTAEDQEKKLQQLEDKLILTQQDLKTFSESSEELADLLKKQQEENQEQLRKINLLFDDSAKDYKIIDFNGLYSLLQKIAERE